MNKLRNSRFVFLRVSSQQDRKAFDMFSGGSDSFFPPDPPPDPPTREQKIPFEFTFKHFVISIVLFILMLVVLYVLEMATKT